MTGPTRPLQTATEVADRLQVKPSTVYEWARMGYLPCVRLGIGKKKPCVRFDPEQIEEWLREKYKRGRMTRLPDA